VIVADPPWRFSDSLPGETRGAGKQYATMSAEEIARYPLPPIADAALLFLWRVSSMQQEALGVARAWGFCVKTELVWVKTSSTGEKLHMGMGRILRGAHETCLVAAFGKYAERVLDKGIRTVLLAPVGAHSEKPDEFYDVVERLFEGPRCELFARKVRPGWTQYGRELPGRPEHP
jgi:N6-adenosine-specific RNA methylase IME4